MLKTWLAEWRSSRDWFCSSNCGWVPVPNFATFSGFRNRCVKNERERSFETKTDLFTSALWKFPLLKVPNAPITVWPNLPLVSVLVLCKTTFGQCSEAIDGPRFWFSQLNLSVQLSSTPTLKLCTSGNSASKRTYKTRRKMKCIVALFRLLYFAQVHVDDMSIKRA